MSKLRIAVGIPAYGDRICAEHAKMWVEFGSILTQSHERFELVQFGYVDVNPIDRARNLLVAHAMIAEADWLLMIDADTWVESNQPDADAGVYLLRMISDADRADATVVAAPVVRRMALGQTKRELAVYTDTDKDEKLHVEMMSGKLEVGAFPESKYQPATEIWGVGEADAVGAACIAVNLKKLGTAYFKFTTELSEDLEFCRQVKAQGGKILVDGRVRTGHLSRSYPIYSSE